MAILLIFGFFWHGFLPQVEVITLHSLGHQSRHYSTIRLWGAVGFIVMVIAVAPLVNSYGTKLIPVLMTLSLLALAASSFLIQARRPSSSPRLSVKPFLKRPEVLALLLVCFLMQLSHGPYYTFFSIYLRTQGYSDAWIGQIWALGVIAEVIVLFFMYRLLPRWGAPILLLVALIATTVRWVLLALFPDLPAMIFFHSSFACFKCWCVSCCCHCFDKLLFYPRSSGEGASTVFCNRLWCWWCCRCLFFWIFMGTYWGYPGFSLGCCCFFTGNTFDHTNLSRYLSALTVYWACCVLSSVSKYTSLP